MSALYSLDFRDTGAERLLRRSPGEQIALRPNIVDAILLAAQRFCARG